MNSPSPLTVVANSDITIGAKPSRRFVGAEHGADISYFYVENQHGEGPGSHWHPYAETWTILAGTARFTIGAQAVVAHASDTVTGPAFVPHSFTNVGDDTLRIICIHPSPTIVQTFIDA